MLEGIGAVKVSRYDTQPPGGPSIASLPANEDPAASPHHPLGKPAAPGAPSMRTRAQDQAQKAASYFTTKFAKAYQAVRRLIGAAWDRIIGRRTGRSVEMDATYRDVHADNITKLEAIVPNSLADNQKIMGTVVDHSVLQNSPLRLEEIKQFVSAGQKIVEALYDLENWNSDKPGAVTLKLHDKVFTLESSQYTTRCISWFIAGRTAQAGLKVDVSGDGPNPLNADGEIVMPDPGHRLEQFLSAAPAATRVHLPKDSGFDHPRHRPEEIDNRENRREYGGPASYVPKTQGCSDDARMSLPRAGGAILFNRIKAGSFYNQHTGINHETDALSITFTRAQNMSFERVDDLGQVERDSWVGNIRQGLQRLLTRSDRSDAVMLGHNAFHTVRSASIKSGGLKETIGKPYHELMMDAANAGLVHYDIYFNDVETSRNRAINHEINEGLDNIAEKTLSLLQKLNSDNPVHPQAEQFRMKAAQLQSIIEYQRSKFGDSSALKLKRIGAERHISLSDPN